MREATSLCQQIIEQLDGKLDSKQIAARYRWSSLSSQDRQCLLQEARTRSTRDPQSSLPLLYALFRMTKEDPWDQLEALALILHLPDAVVPQGDKRRGMRRLYDLLNQLMETPCAQDGPRRCRLLQHRSDYYALRAHLMLESGEEAEALRSYEKSLDVLRELARLAVSGDSSNSLPALDDLLTERDRLQSEVATISRDLRDQQKLLSDASSELEKATQSRGALLQELEELRERAQQREDKLAHLHSDIERLQRTKAEAEEGLREILRAIGDAQGRLKELREDERTEKRERDLPPIKGLEEIIGGSASSRER